MTLSFKTGNWVSRNTVGTDIITGLGFQPKAIILYSSAYFVAFDTIDGYTYHSIGAAVNTTASNQRSLFCVSTDAAATSDTHQVYNSTAVLTPGVADGNDAIGSISAISSDGFTVNWSTISRATKTEYFCLGGADLTNAAVGDLTVPSSTGNQSVTGLGFQPDAIILFGSGNTSSATVTGFNRGLGFGISSSAQVCNSSYSKQAQATMICKHYQRGSNTACYALVDDTTPTNVGLEGALVSMDVGGFTINWTTVATAQQGVKVAYLAIKGGSYKVGSISSPTAGTAPVSQATTGVGFQPRGLVVSTVGAATATTVGSNNQVGLGSGNSASSRNSGYSSDNDGAAAAVTMNVNKTNRIVTMYTAVGAEASSTVNAEADLTSLDSNGFTLSWTTKSGTTAYECIYLAAGDAAAVAGGPRNFQVVGAYFTSDS